MPVRAIGGKERLEIKPSDRVKHEPREMILRQPLPQRRRQQKRLLTITINEVLSHPGIQRTRADRPPFMRHPPRKARPETRASSATGCLSKARPGSRHSPRVVPSIGGPRACCEHPGRLLHLSRRYGSGRGAAAGGPPSRSGSQITGAMKRAFPGGTAVAVDRRSGCRMVSPARVLLVRGGARRDWSGQDGPL